MFLRYSEVLVSSSRIRNFGEPNLRRLVDWIRNFGKFPPTPLQHKLNAALILVLINTVKEYWVQLWTTPCHALMWQLCHLDGGETVNRAICYCITIISHFCILIAEHLNQGRAWDTDGETLRIFFILLLLLLSGSTSLPLLLHRLAYN